MGGSCKKVGRTEMYTWREQAALTQTQVRSCIVPVPLSYPSEKGSDPVISDLLDTSESQSG